MNFQLQELDYQFSDHMVLWWLQEFYLGWSLRNLNYLNIFLSIIF